VDQRYLTLQQVSEYIGFSPKTLYTWVEEGKIPAYKVGRAWRFDVNEIDTFIKNKYNGATCSGVELDRRSK